MKCFIDHISKVDKFSHFIPLSNPYNILTHDNDARKTWHEMVGHLNYKNLFDLCEKYMVIGFPKIKFSKGVCQGCILGKHQEKKYERVNHERTSTPIDLINNDIDSPFPSIQIFSNFNL